MKRQLRLLAAMALLAACRPESHVEVHPRVEPPVDSPNAIPDAPVSGTVRGAPFAVRDARYVVDRRVGYAHTDLLLSAGRAESPCGPISPARATSVWLRLDGDDKIEPKDVRIGATGEGPFDGLLHGQIGQRGEHHGVAKSERLARRQANQARQGDFALGQIVLIGRQPLLIGNQLHLGAGDVDVGRQAGGVPVGGLLRHGLRRRDLRPCDIHASGGGEHVR